MRNNTFVLSGRFLNCLSFTQGAASLALGYARLAFALSGRLLLSLFSQGIASLALGYVRLAFALSGRLLVIDVCINNVYGGLKAQYSSIAQGKWSGTLGN